jgi:ribosome maturation factor RimP
VEIPGVKGRKATTRRIAFADIDRARVQVEFNRKDKHDKHDKSDKQDEQDPNDMMEEEEA